MTTKRNLAGRRTRIVAGLLLAALSSRAFADESVLSVPQIRAVAIDGDDSDWAANGYGADALADVRVGHRPDLPPSPRVRLGWDASGLLIFVRTADKSVTDPSMSDGDRVEVLAGSLHENGKGFQLSVVPNRSSRPTPPAVTWTDKRSGVSAPLKVDVASSGSPDGYAVELRLPWSDFAGAANVGSAYRVQVQVEDAAVGMDRVTFTLKPTTESRWLEPAQLSLIRLADHASPPARLAVYAEYQRYRRTQVRITDTAADGDTRYVVTDAAGRAVGEAAMIGRAGDTSRVTVNLPMPQPMPADRALVVTRVAKAGRPAESASVVPAGPLGREDALATAEFRFDTTVFAGTVFPIGDFADPLAVEDLIGPYTVVRRFFDADLNEVMSADKPGRYGVLVTINGQGGLKGQREVTLYRVPQAYTWGTQAVGGKDVSPPAAFGLPSGAVSTQQKTVGSWLADAIRSDARHTGSTATVLSALAEAGPDAPPFVQRDGPDARDEHWWHALEKKLGIAKSYPYLAVLPDDYAAPDAAAKKFPLLIFLHGVGQCGDDPKDLADWGPMPVLRDRRGNPFIAVAPRCPYRDWWRVDRLNDLIDELSAKYRVDSSRIYLTGLSMGGGGTWAYAAAFPERLAAAVPICANGDYDDLAQLKQVSLWAFLGVRDPGVDANQAKAAFATLRSLGGDAKLTAYEDGGHDIWDRAYRSDELYAWLLTHQRQGR